MKFVERVKLVEGLSYEARLAYVAFCVERCLTEATRHPAAARQLEQLPLLREGLESVWARAEKKNAPTTGRIQEIAASLETYEVGAPDAESTVYLRDPILAHGARMLMKGMRLLQNPNETARYVAGAEAGPYLAVGLAYAEWKKSQQAELAVIESALLRLTQSKDKPFSRSLFANIPDWPRGEPSKKYAAGQVKGEGPTGDDD